MDNVLDQIEQLMTSIGSMAEMCGALRRQLIANGFTDAETLELVKVFMLNGLQQ